MNRTRSKILETLRSKPRASVNDLAKAVGINPISVRHHVSSLMADGLLLVEEIRHGVGRPRQVYSLSEKAREQYSAQYLRLTNRLLDYLKQTVPQPVVHTLFEKMAGELAADTKPGFSDLPIEHKLDAIQTILEKEGFVIEWEPHEAGYLIHERSCPYFHIGQQHPEVCAVDKTLIADMLDLPVQKVSCLLSGDTHCVYQVTLAEKEDSK